MLICAFDIRYTRNRYSRNKSHRKVIAFLLVVGDLIQLLFFY